VAVDSESAKGDGPPPATVSLAAERTWLAWWRTALAASAGALAIGRIAPQALDVSRGPFVALGTLYGVLAIGTLLVGAHRQRKLQRAAWTGTDVSLPFAIVACFTAGGVLLAGATVVLVLAEA
jgi:inner membrane protein YidH